MVLHARAWPGRRQGCPNTRGVTFPPVATAPKSHGHGGQSGRGYGIAVALGGGVHRPYSTPVSGGRAINLTTLLSLSACLTLIAAIYGSVGKASASGFLAVMGLFGLAPETIKPTALVLNLLVSSVVAVRCARAGHFSSKLLWPFLLLSIPAAFVGGWLTLPAVVFNRLLGVLLVLAGVPFFRGKPPASSTISPLSAAIAMAAGARSACCPVSRAWVAASC